MDNVQTTKAPVHLWIAGLLSLAWNGFGCYDYLMTRMRNEDYFRSMAPDIDPHCGSVKPVQTRSPWLSRKTAVCDSSAGTMTASRIGTRWRLDCGMRNGAVPDSGPRAA